MSASPPLSIRVEMVTKVFAAPGATHTSPLIMCRSQAERASSSEPTSTGSTCASRLLAVSMRPSSWAISAARTSRCPLRTG